MRGILAALQRNGSILYFRPLNLNAGAILARSGESAPAGREGWCGGGSERPSDDGVGERGCAGGMTVLSAFLPHSSCDISRVDAYKMRVEKCAANDGPFTSWGIAPPVLVFFFLSFLPSLPLTRQFARPVDIYTCFARRTKRSPANVNFRGDGGEVRKKSETDSSRDVPKGF